MIRAREILVTAMPVLLLCLNERRDDPLCALIEASSRSLTY